MGATNIMWHLAKGQTEEAAWAAARNLFLGMFHEAVLAGGRRTIQEWAKRIPAPSVGVACPTGTRARSARCSSPAAPSI